MKQKMRISTISALVSAILLNSQTVYAQAEQESKDGAKVDERIQITGSYIRRSDQMESSTPLAVIDAGDLADLGVKSVADITQTLTINTGAENTPDAYTQNNTVGTTNINLRGLGLASTLVLVNGKRQVNTAITSNGGVSFVDTSSMLPMIALGRVEVVKDGASAIYGSDAVAGVVNFITRKDFDGALFSVDYLDGAYGDYGEYTAQGLWGLTSEKGSALLAIGYTDRTELLQADHRLGRPGVDATSNLGSPGSYLAGPYPIIDPTGCEEVGGVRALLAPAGVGPGGTDVGWCRFDFGDYYNLVPEETKLTGYAQATYDFSDTLTWTTEFSFARNKATRNASPSFPNLSFPVVPASHPDNPFGFDVRFAGRAVGNGAPLDYATYTGESYTNRFSTNLQGELETGYWQVSLTRATNDYVITAYDTLATEFENALNGFGGPDCVASTGTAGQGNCMYFNPFASSYTTSPNDPSVIDSFIADTSTKAKSDLTVIDALYTSELFEFGADSVYIAAGLQYRDQTIRQDFSSLQNNDRFVFTVGNPDIGGDADAIAAFVELAIPFSEALDVQVAARYEDHGGAIGSTFDPKLAFVYRATDTLNFRGSISTSFRTPSVFQQQGVQTSLERIEDPLNPGGATFVAVRTRGNENLVPEESTAFNIGMSFEPIEQLKIDLDYWSFDFENVIVQTNSQATVNAAAETGNTEDVIRIGDPTTGVISQINTSFVNASNVETSGLDFNISYLIETDMGTIEPTLGGTYIREYDLVDPLSGTVDGVGKRNFRNFGTSTPELRYNIGLAWKGENISANLFARYIDSYIDDENCEDGSRYSESPTALNLCSDGFYEIDSHMTVDAQVNFDMAKMLDLNNSYTLTLGGINITNDDPPTVYSDGGFDSKVHDPRGRMVYIKLTAGF